MNPFAPEKGGAQGLVFLAAGCRHSKMENLFAYLNGTDSYIKLQLIIFEF